MTEPRGQYGGSEPPGSRPPLAKHVGCPCHDHGAQWTSTANACLTAERSERARRCPQSRQVAVTQAGVVFLDQRGTPRATPNRSGAPVTDSTIIYTHTDEAPALASIRCYGDPGLRRDRWRARGDRDISLAGRIMPASPSGSSGPDIAVRPRGAGELVRRPSERHQAVPTCPPPARSEGAIAEFRRTAIRYRLSPKNRSPPRHNIRNR